MEKSGPDPYAFFLETWSFWDDQSLVLQIFLNITFLVDFFDVEGFEKDFESMDA